MESFAKVSNVIGKKSGARLEDSAPFGDNSLPYWEGRGASKLAKAEISSDSRCEAFEATSDARQGNRLGSGPKKPIDLILRKLSTPQGFKFGGRAHLVEVNRELRNLRSV